MCVFLWSESWDSFLTTSETSNRDAGSCWNSSLWLKRDAGLNDYSWINRNKLKYLLNWEIELKPAVPRTSTWGAVPIWWKMVRQWWDTWDCDLALTAQPDRAGNQTWPAASRRCFLPLSTLTETHNLKVVHLLALLQDVWSWKWTISKGMFEKHAEDGRTLPHGSFYFSTSPV